MEPENHKRKKTSTKRGLKELGKFYKQYLAAAYGNCLSEKGDLKEVSADTRAALSLGGPGRDPLCSVYTPRDDLASYVQHLSSLSPPAVGLPLLTPAGSKKKKCVFYLEILGFKISFNFSFLKNNVLHVLVFCLCVCMCTMYLPGTYQKRSFVPLGLALQMLWAA